MRSKTAGLFFVIGIVIIASCSTPDVEIPPTLMPAATDVPLSEPTPTSDPPTATPPLLPEIEGDLDPEFLVQAGELCDTAFDAGITFGWTWASMLPTAVIFDRDYDVDPWGGFDLLESAREDELESITCIKETRIDKGFYIGTAGGGRGYQLQWDLWVLGWPEGAPLASITFLGSPPPTSVSSGGNHYGSEPKSKALSWLDAQFAEPWLDTLGTPSEFHISEDGALLIADFNKFAGVFDLESGELLRQIDYAEDGSFVPFVTFSQFGDLFAATICAQEQDDECVFNVIEVRDTVDGTLVQRLSWEEDYPLIYNHAFTPDNLYLYAGHSGTIDGTTRYYIRRWDLRTGLGTDFVSNEIGRDSDLLVSPDGSQIVIREGSSKIVWDTQSNERIASYSANDNNKIDHPMSYSPDSAMLAASHCADGGYDYCFLGQIKLFETGEYKEIGTFGSSQGFFDSVAFSADGALMAGGECDFTRPFIPENKMERLICTSGIVHVWDVSSGDELFSFPGHSGEIRSLIFSHDGNYLFSGSTDGTTHRWPLH
ncbi:MAG: hypothetical protein WBB69_08330 [Anaerolineales bacterium]